MPAGDAIPYIEIPGKPGEPGKLIRAVNGLSTLWMALNLFGNPVKRGIYGVDGVHCIKYEVIATRYYV